MKRKLCSGLVLCLALMASVLLVASTAAAKEKTYNLKMHSYAPPPPAAAGVGMQWFMDEVTKRTDGRVKFTTFWSSSLAPPKGQLELIQRGAVDIEKTCTLYFPGKFVISHFEYSFPFNPTDPVMVTKAKRQIYEEFPEKREEYKKFNTIMLANHTAPYYQLLAKKPIEKIEDLNGMKIGLVGRWFGKWLEPVGVAPVVMPAGERYVGLQSGTIDADLLWLDLQAAFSLDEQADYIVQIPFGSFVPEDVMMNLDSFNKLPEDIQQILLEVGKESELYVANYLKERHDIVMKQMQEKGLKALDFPKSEIAKWAKIIPDTPAVWAKEAADAGLPGWEIAARWQEITAELGHEWPREWAVKQ